MVKSGGTAAELMPLRLRLSSSLFHVVFTTWIAHSTTSSHDIPLTLDHLKSYQLYSNGPVRLYSKLQIDGNDRAQSFSSIDLSGPIKHLDPSHATFETVRNEARERMCIRTYFWPKDWVPEL
ncbi:hypothetical protein D9613_008869 [Agrocybe pediades]|uniref:Uncharacterized protein n=1 Tax=Agrocybe pediades TaxID=84607 RepID=A0A8H4VMR8_9AGAR|nr:hypothetical protein D9613_008869 [Agrocybe pediades]